MTENIQQFLERFHTDGCADAYRFLGCHCLPSGGAIFRVWAPRAESVSVVGEFNFWNEQDLLMQSQMVSGRLFLYMPHREARTNTA